MGECCMARLAAYCHAMAAKSASVQTLLWVLGKEPPEGWMWDITVEPQAEVEAKPIPDPEESLHGVPLSFIEFGSEQGFQISQVILFGTYRLFAQPCTLRSDRRHAEQFALLLDGCFM
jgi:hypothetical protein